MSVKNTERASWHQQSGLERVGADQQEVSGDLRHPDTETADTCGEKHADHHDAVIAATIIISDNIAALVFTREVMAG